VVYDPKDKPGALHLNVGGPNKQIKVGDHPADTCPDCAAAAADPENPRDYCAQHDHVLRAPEAP
jgi:hypothetical protein